MGVKVATSCFHWTQPIVPHSSSSSQTLASTVSSPYLKRRSFSHGSAVFQFIQRLDRSTLFGTKIHGSGSCPQQKPRGRTIKRACSASLDAFSDEDFSRKIEELATRYQLSDDDEESTEPEIFTDPVEIQRQSNNGTDFVQNHRNFEPLEPPEWLPESDGIIPASIERKANSVHLPLSLRIIKRKKKQWQEGFREAGESACCSVKKAFSSMVFIIRELHSFTLQTRETLLYEDLQGILGRVQREIHASFVWLFQQVFSHTPTLMVSVMILLANYSVHSMAANAAISQPPPPLQSRAVTTESISGLEDQGRTQKFDSSAIKTFSVHSSGGKSSSVGGSNGGGGGKFRPVASGTGGEEQFDGSTSLNSNGSIISDRPLKTSVAGEESVSGQEETMVWEAMVEEASEMQAATRDEALDGETVRRFVSPVTAKIDVDNDYEDYARTKLAYQTGLAQDPNNPLLLANYAQFLYLVGHDYDRAEEYFKKAAAVEPPDAEALSNYASFLWKARNNLWAAEETYLKAIDADPGNSYYAANYAHFLWNTGGEDTCFPLDNNDADPTAA
ncbi:hypothetical protein NMG60_11014501 [Bertholletia excelsa]